MKRLWLVILFILLPVNVWGACTGASPTWNATLDRASVAICVAAAANGDTVNVAGGSEIWESEISWSGKNLRLVGANKSSIITVTGTALGFGASENPPTNSSTITGFTLTCTASTTSSHQKIRAAGRGWRIYNNKFDCPGKFTVGVGVVSNSSRTASMTGLVDNNEFIGARVLVTDWPGIGETWQYNATQWYTPLALGTSEAVYVEDNSFIATIHANAIDANYGGRYVFRFNTLNGPYIEAHGITGKYRGTRKWEIYHNRLEPVGISPQWVTLIRAGTGVMFNNVAVGSFVQHYQTDHRRSFEVVALGFCDMTNVWDENNPAVGTGWLCRDQVGAGGDVAIWLSGLVPPVQVKTPAYAWNNLLNGVVHALEVQANSTTHIIPDRDLFAGTFAVQSSPTSPFNGTTGVGHGIYTNRPATCTAGVGYWATDLGYWNTKNDTPTVTADGVFYKCDVSGAWTLYYVPYLYPHPLRSGLSAPSGVVVDP